MEYVYCFGCQTLFGGKEFREHSIMPPTPGCTLCAFTWAPNHEFFSGFGPGWPTLQQEPPDLVEVPFTEAVELLLKHWSPSVQVMLETLKQKYGVVLARSPK